jgi:hypothetical protein
MVSLKKHYTKKSLSRGHHLPLSSTPYQLSVTFSHTFLNRSAKILNQIFFPPPP